MRVTIETDLTLHGLEAIVLDNGVLRVTVLPTSGGRIWQVQSLRTGRRLLWNNPRIAPGRWPIGTSFDDTFSGGWDVLFPNDEPETLADEPFPDHGELWAASWASSTTHDEHGAAVINLRLATPISQCEVHKRVRLAPAASRIEIVEAVTSQARMPLPALWKQHLALALDDDGGRLDVPGARAELADWGSPRAGQAGDVYDWPRLGEVDMAQVPATGDDSVEFQYLTDLTEPKAALLHPDGDRVELSWRSDHLDSLWLFASHGAWRGNRVVVLEPCSGTPLSVNEGVAAGTHRVLQPGETWRAEMALQFTPGPSTKGQS